MFANLCSLQEWRTHTVMAIKIVQSGQQLPLEEGLYNAAPMLTTLPLGEQHAHFCLLIDDFHEYDHAQKKRSSW